MPLIVLRSSLALCLFVLVLQFPRASAAQPPKGRAPLPGEQWVQLFNGKDLTNWVPVGKWPCSTRPGST